MMNDQQKKELNQQMAEQAIREFTKTATKIALATTVAIITRKLMTNQKFDH